MKILVLSPTLRNTSPSMRFRLEQWAPYLEQEGFRFTYAPFEDEGLHRILYQAGRYVSKSVLMLRALARRVRLLGSLRDFDLVYLHREAALVGPALLERRIAASGRPMVYDFDDPIWIPYRSPTNRFFGRLKCPGKTATICRLASAVLVGNRLLAGWAEQHSSNVHVVPSTIDVEHYPVKPATAPDGVVTLGWTGSHSTLPFLDLLKEVLHRLAARHAFRLLVIAHTDRYRIEGAPYEVVGKQWRAETEAVDLHAIDIGLGPFPDSGWTPWRCHGKVLQYMAAGIPTVATRLGILPDYICDGEEGFLVSTVAEWVERLSLLIENAALRREMGRRARQTVEAKYAARWWAPRVANILRGACGRPAAQTTA